MTADILLHHAGQEIATDPENWVPFLQQLREQYRKGDFGRLGRVLHQGSAGEAFMSLENAYFFAQIYCALLSGDCLVVDIEVGATPVKDREVARNNRLLQRLRPPFSAIFVGGGAGPDGSLRWSRPIWVTRVDEPTPERRESLKAGSAPLEVGTISAARVWMALFFDGVILARWPYESERITLLYHKARPCRPLPPLELDVPKRSLVAPEKKRGNAEEKGESQCRHSRRVALASTEAQALQGIGQRMRDDPEVLQRRLQMFVDAMPPLDLPEIPRIRRAAKDLEAKLRHSDKKVQRMVARVVRQSFSRIDVQVRVLVDLEAREGQYIPRYVMLRAGERSELLRPADAAASARRALPVTCSLLASTRRTSPQLLEMIESALEKLDRC